MKKRLVLAVGLIFFVTAHASQGKPVIVVNAFTKAAGVELPYDMKLLQTQLLPEFKVMLSKQFDIVSEPPTAPQGTVYTLDAEITAGVPATLPMRILVGLGSGREASDIQFRVMDGSASSIDRAIRPLCASGQDRRRAGPWRISERSMPDRITEAKLQ